VENLKKNSNESTSDQPPKKSPKEKPSNRSKSRSQQTIPSSEPPKEPSASLVGLLQQIYGEVKRAKVANLLKQLPNVEHQGINWNSVVEIIATGFKSDPFFDLLTKILQTVASQDLNTRLYHSLAESASEALRLHPVLKHSSFMTELEVKDLDVAIESLLRLVRTAQFTDLNLESSKDFTKSKREKFGKNVVKTYILILLIQQKLTLDQLKTLEPNYLWPQRRMDDRQRIASLLSSTDQHSIGFLTRFYGDQLRDISEKLQDSNKSLLQARSTNEAISRENNSLAVEIDRLNAAIKSQLEQIAELHQALGDEKLLRESSDLRWSNQTNAFRGTIKRQLASHLDLLTDSLEALRINRTNVAQEYVETICKQLKKQISSIEEGE